MRWFSGTTVGLCVWGFGFKKKRARRDNCKKKDSSADMKKGGDGGTKGELDLAITVRKGARSVAINDAIPGGKKRGNWVGLDWEKKLAK